MKPGVTQITVLLCIMSVLVPSLPRARAEALHGLVASVHPVATEAGLRALKQGGNAVDAAVAVALTLGVVDSDNSGIGGGCFILIRRADGSLVAIDGRETAPAAATTNMFVRNGKADTRLSQTGALASGVPGALAAYEYAIEHYGRATLKNLILPAANIAREGFKLDAAYARYLKGHGTVSFFSGCLFQRFASLRRRRSFETTGSCGDLPPYRRAGQQLVLSRPFRRSR